MSRLRQVGNGQLTRLRADDVVVKLATDGFPKPVHSRHQLIAGGDSGALHSMEALSGQI